MVLYFGSLDRNEKEKCISGTKKCSQYNMKIIMINKLQRPNYECLGLVWFTFFHHSSLITQFPSLITHHSPLITLKYQGCLVPSLSFHHSLFFTLFGGPTPVTVQLFFFFFPSTQQLKPSEKKKKKLVKKTEPSEEERKKEKKKTNEEDRTR